MKGKCQQIHSINFDPQIFWMGVKHSKNSILVSINLSTVLVVLSQDISKIRKQFNCVLEKIIDSSWQKKQTFLRMNVFSLLSREIF